jgi:hypothetical protein
VGWWETGGREIQIKVFILCGTEGPPVDFKFEIGKVGQNEVDVFIHRVKTRGQGPVKEEITGRVANGQVVAFFQPKCRRCYTDQAISGGLCQWRKIPVADLITVV